VEEADAADAAATGAAACLSLDGIYGQGNGVATRVVADETLLVPFRNARLLQQISP
jgi:hypothetical protein